MSRDTQAMRDAWPQTCSDVPLVAHYIAHGVKVQVHKRAGEATQALCCVLLAHSYHVRAGDTGAYNCRPITGNKKKTSLHAHGIAIDINWNTNPYRSDGKLVTDMSGAMVADAERIKTKGGVIVWRWGGHYSGAKDAMHFEVMATPEELALGIDWSTVRMPARNSAQAATWPPLQVDDRGPTVKTLQEKLGILADGIFGPNTKIKLIEYQQSRGLKADGEVGLATWTAILHQQLPIGPGIPSPVKLG